jgi:hypothetical protein
MRAAHAAHGRGGGIGRQYFVAGLIHTVVSGRKPRSPYEGDRESINEDSAEWVAVTAIGGDGTGKAWDLPGIFV